MSVNWRWCLKIGAIIALVDLVTVGLSISAGAESATAAVLQSIDEIVNIALFATVGFRVGRDTGRATSAAEGGVIASIVPGTVAAITALLRTVYQIAPPGQELELYQLVIASLAWNIVLGGITALFSGWIASRSKSAVR